MEAGELNANMLGTGDAYLNGEKVELVVEGSTITGNEEGQEGTGYGFTIYPNPANNGGEITYHIKSGSSARILVYNALGQIVAEESKLEGQGTLQVGNSDWSSGMYNIILYTEGAERLVKKWIIQK